jgi:glucosamine kinase
MTVPRPLLDGSAARGLGHVVGVDGGATKTAAAVLDLMKTKISTGQGGPSNADAVGAEAAVEALQEAVDDALRGAGVAKRDVGAAVIALAGTVSPEFERAAHRALGLEQAYFVNDVVGAWAAGTNCTAGVAVVSGTGSHVFGVDAGGRSWRVGGWGHILGDEGSGYALGLGAMKAALSFRDGSGPATALLDVITAFYELDAIEDLQELFYGKPLTKAEIAACAGEVLATAGLGDAVALGLVDTGAAELARQTEAAVRRLALDADFVLALVGSIFGNSKLMRDRFEQKARAFAPGARFVVPAAPPVMGSLLLAVNAEGRGSEVDVEVIAAQLEALAPARTTPM